MYYTIKGDSDCPLVEITLNQNEKVKIERGSMAYMSNVSLEGKMNSKGSGFMGVLGAIGRSIASGESMFITEATGLNDEGVIGVAPKTPGKISALTVDYNHQYCLNSGAFVASDITADYEIITQKVSKAILGGTGGFFIMKTSGEGDVLISAYGDLLELEVDEYHPLTVDNEHVVAWDVNLDYEIKVASGTFGFVSGEGFVNEFHGNGKIYIQTRNIHNLADALIPYMPRSSND